MAKDSALPFEEGQLVETKSFIPGFRGAWFRCEITEISWKKDRFGHVLHYLDFPDEKKKWMETYQAPPNPDGHSKKKRDRAGSLKKEVKTERQLMLRPAYPPIYHKDQLISTSTSSETRVVVEGGWRVGDPVDWLEDGCYWSGKVTQIIDEEKAMVKLLPPPLGEGQSYEASMSRLRPTLDWSVESGWTVPTPEGVADFHQRVHIVHPEKQTVGDELVASEKPHCEVLRELPVTDGLPDVVPGDSVRASPRVDADLEIKHESLSKTKPKSLTNEVIDKPETTVKAPENAKEMVDTPETTAFKHDNGETLETIMKAPEKAEVPLMSDKVDPIEAALMDLEELANRLIWLKQVLKHGYPLPDDASSPSWEFVEHRSSSMP